MRRDFLTYNVKKDLKDTLTNVSASDGCLFGKGLGERIKASKDIQKAGLDLKPIKASKPNSRGNNRFKKPSQQLPVNSYRPTRQLQGTTGRGGEHSRVPSQPSQMKAYYTQRTPANQDRRRRQEVRHSNKSH